MTNIELATIIAEAVAGSPAQVAAIIYNELMEV